MTKVLLIGNGAREHAVAKALKKSRYDVELFVVGKTKNPEIAELCEEYMLADVSDAEAVKDFANEIRPDFAFMGPEAPIAAGVVDALLELEIHSVGPLETVGRLESSKSFTRDLMEKYQIPGNPKFKTFFDADGLENWFLELGENYVVKADGLRGGKGVKVAGDHLKGMEEGIAYAQECIEAEGKVVVEEKLVGQEFSLMFFCDGVNVVPMPVVQDHKRAYEGDKGPNTGGMGSYSDTNHLLPFVTMVDMKEAHDITKKVVHALFEETGSYFKGIVFGGFMVTADGVRLIEYNARFGDPEAMNVLAILKTDFVDICEAIINKTLDQVEVEFERKATVCKYVVPEGYPDNPVKGEKIEVGEVPEGALLYYASVDEREDGLYLGGSRAVACVGVADTIAEAEKIAQSAVEVVKGPVFYRRDVGTQELIDSRVEMMKKIRL